MKLLSLELEHFRNYSSLSLSFRNERNIVVLGENGQGKTNLLEAISVLALSKSFQEVRPENMIQWQDEGSNVAFFRLKANIESKKGLRKLEIVQGMNRKIPKMLKVDEVVVSPSEYLGNFQVVVFTPQDIEMVTHTPQIRRRALNIMISQIDPTYLKSLRQYQQVVKQRNKLLQKIRDEKKGSDELPYWNQLVAEEGSFLIMKRIEVIENLQPHLEKFYEQMNTSPSKLYLQWKKPWESKEQNGLTSEFLQALLTQEKRDIEEGATSIGPHREDFIFLLHEKPLALFGSRGECRSAVLAFKLAEMKLIEQRTGDTPVLLLDDVFSELDSSRQRELMKCLSAEQIFITATHLEFEIQESRILLIENGKIRE